MPVRPSVPSTMVLAESNSRVKLMEAMANGAPCETMRRQEVINPSMEKSSANCTVLSVSFAFGFHQWLSRMAMPIRWPTTVAAEEPAMPHPNQCMKTMSRQRLAALSMMTASDTSLGCPSTPTMVESPHMRMNAVFPNNRMRI